MTLLEQRRTVNQRQSDQRDQRVFQQCIGTFHTRVLLGILVALIALMHTARAQDTSKIPTLQLWYEAKGISHVNYLEGYDKQGGGDNALIVRKNSRPQLWYLKDGTIDTSSARPVPDCDPYWVGEVDLNGDGLKEMIDWRANVFVRPNAGEPYGLQSVARYAETGKAFFYGSRTFIGDFDGDGKEDFMGVYRTQTMIARLLMGGNDLTKLRVIELPRIPDPAYRLQYVVGAWREADGTNKLVVYQQLDTGALEREEAFFLYSFRIAGDSVLYTPLDTTEFKTFKDKVTPSFRYNSSFVWHSSDMSQHSLIVSYNADVEGQTDIYRITQNKLQYVHTKKTTEGGAFVLKYGVINKNNSGYVRGYTPFLYIYEGNPTEDTLAKAWIKSSGIQDITSIGDINNDGHGDIAVIRGETLYLYLGVSPTTSVNTLADTMSMSINNNQPCSKSGILNISFTLPNIRGEILCTLYSLQGKAVADLGTYPITSGTVSIPLSGYGLSPGIYNLRCTVAGRVVDKGLIITE